MTVPEPYQSFHWESSDLFESVPIRETLEGGNCLERGCPGCTRNLSMSQKREHLVQILGLNYGIFDPVKARRGVCELLWKGLWRDKTADGPSMQLEAYQRVHEDVTRYLAVLNIFVAELKGDTRLRRYVEGCIAWHLRNNHPEHKEQELLRQSTDSRHQRGMNLHTPKRFRLIRVRQGGCANRFLQSLNVGRCA